MSHPLLSGVRAAFAASLLVLSTALAPPVRAADVAPRREQGPLVFDGIPAADPAIAASLGQWLESRPTGLVDWLADGSLVIATRFANTEQLHRVRAPLGMREQLTWYPDAVRSGAASPVNPNLIAFLRDEGGNENAQVYLRDLSTGATRLLSDGKSLNGGPVWSNDGRRIAFHSNARNGVSYDIYVSDVEANTAPRLVLGGGDQAYYVADWSVDDRRLLVIRYHSIADADLLVADIATGQLTQLEPTADLKLPTAIAGAHFSRDGRGVYFVSDHGGEFTELRYADMFTLESRSLTPRSRADVELLAVARDGRRLAYALNEGGVSRLVVYDIAQRTDLLLPPLPPGSVIAQLGFDQTGQRLAVAAESAQSPRDIHVYDFSAGRPALTRWTRGEIGPVDATKLVAPRPFTFPTWDRVGNAQREIPAFIYRPATPGPHPVLIDIHGGPESQFRPGWSAFTQYLVAELGYVVIAPNVRGSSGYGRSYLALDDGRLREDSVRDIGSLIVWAGLQPDLDRSRIVVMGGSYGGYMTLASLVHYGDRLAGGVDVVGISNFVTFLENTSAYRRDLRRAEYGDERNPQTRAFLQRISPLNNAASITKPLLIVQGLNDPRVPASESEQMLARIRAGGREAWYLAAKDEGHGFRKKANRDAYLETVVQFLKRLAGGG